MKNGTVEAKLAWVNCSLVNSLNCLALDYHKLTTMGKIIGIFLNFDKVLTTLKKLQKNYQVFFLLFHTTFQQYMTCL